MWIQRNVKWTKIITDNVYKSEIQCYMNITLMLILGIISTKSRFIPGLKLGRKSWTFVVNQSNQYYYVLIYGEN